MVDHKLIKEAKRRVQYGKQTTADRFLKSTNDKVKESILKEVDDD